ncbi:MAG: transposase [Patescibacteria group bacterium]|jgi:REP element-mobilizing transposase RayT
MKKFGNRQTIRLKKYDYSEAGCYFVTICAQNRKNLFDDIVVGATRGSPLNEIINNIWKSLPDHHPVKLDEFVIMPNHVHFIIHIINKGGSRPAPTLGTIIGLFKSECTKQIRKSIQNNQFNVWQRSYYEHIIRNEKDLNKIRRYIRDNPMNWEEDRNNLKSKGGELIHGY